MAKKKVKDETQQESLTFASDYRDCSIFMK